MKKFKKIWHYSYYFYSKKDENYGLISTHQTLHLFKIFFWIPSPVKYYSNHWCNLRNQNRDKFIKHLTSNLLASRTWCREYTQGFRAPAALAEDREFSALAQWITSIGNFSSRGIPRCFLTSVGLGQAHGVNISTHKSK